MPPQLFFVPPMECKEVKHASEIPRGPQWLYEAKFDGYRCIAIKQPGEVNLYSRPGNSFDGRFPNIAEALMPLKAKQFILDGEIVALDEDGRTNFNALQRARRGPLKVHTLFSICCIWRART